MIERAWISKKVMPRKPGVSTVVVTRRRSKRAGAAAAVARPPGRGGSRRLSQRTFPTLERQFDQVKHVF